MRVIPCTCNHMDKEFDRWNARKKQIEVRSFTGYVHEREVWWCAVGVNVGVEANGKNTNFERPVLILRKFSRDAVLVIPLTTRVKLKPYHVAFYRRGEQAAAVVSQLRLVSTRRLLRKIYRMDSVLFAEISERTALAINNRPPRERGSRRPHGH